MADIDGDASRRRFRRRPIRRRRILLALAAAGASGGCLTGATLDSASGERRRESTDESRASGAESTGENRTGAGAASAGPRRGESETMTADETADDATTDRPDAASARAGDRLEDVRGAVYFPFRAFNGYRTWAEYDPEVAVHDLDCAVELRLNALRVLVSYEYWRKDPETFERRFDHFLRAAGERGVRILPVLFESIGEQPTSETVTRDVPIKSPRRAVLTNPGRWDEPGEFVARIADRYGGREEVLALEVMNEPGTWTRRVNFVREMLRAARDADDSLPLTVGCKTLANNEQYRDPPLSVYQFHYNLPKTAEHMRRALREAVAVQRREDVPVWLTEWQRTLEEPPHRMRPNYASLAKTVRESDVAGDFFWQLVVNPAYNLPVRRRGRINGVFTDDGGVYSAADAGALAGDDDWSKRERRPDWIREFSADGADDPE